MEITFTYIAFFSRSLEKIAGIDEANETTRLKSDFEKSKNPSKYSLELEKCCFLGGNIFDIIFLFTCKFNLFSFLLGCFDAVGVIVYMRTEVKSASRYDSENASKV